MVKMDLGASDGQASSVASTMTQKISSYQEAITQLQRFADEEELKGKGYDSAKSYATSVLVSFYQGLILVSEGLVKSTVDLPGRYRSEVGGESLDSDELERDIESLNRMIVTQQIALGMAYDRPSLDQSTINNIRFTIQNLETKRDEQQEKLTKLLEFNAVSPQIFEGQASLEASVQQGLSQISAGFSNFNGKTFTLPPAEQMAWAKNVQTAWEKRDMDKKYQEVLDKVKNNINLTENDAKAIRQYGSKHPDKKMPSNLIEALKKYVEYNYKIEDVGQDLIDKFLDPKEWLGATVGSLLDTLNEIAIKKGKNLGRVFGAYLQPRDVKGRFVKDTFKPRKWLSGKLKGMSNSTSKIIGRAAKIGGFALTAVLEGREHYKEYKNVGRAVSYGTVAGLVGLGVGVAVGAAVTAPFVITLGIGFLAGTAASIGLKALYKNVKPVREVIDGAGDMLNTAGKEIANVSKNIGKVFSNPFGAMKGVSG